MAGVAISVGSSVKTSISESTVLVFFFAAGVAPPLVLGLGCVAGTSVSESEFARMGRVVALRAFLVAAALVLGACACSASDSDGRSWAGGGGALVVFGGLPLGGMVIRKMNTGQWIG